MADTDIVLVAFYIIGGLLTLGYVDWREPINWLDDGIVCLVIGAAWLPIWIGICASICVDKVKRRRTEEKWRNQDGKI